MNAVRLEVFRQLLRIEKDKAYIGHLQEKQVLSALEKRKVSDLVAGVTRLKRRLDFWISALYKGRLTKMEPSLHTILRIALYELTETETPAYAVLDEVVEWAKKEVRPQAAKLVNGILRSFLRWEGAWPRPETPSLIENLAIWHSHPTWLVEKWYKTYGAEVVNLLEWNNARPLHHLRINTLKTTVKAMHEALAAAELTFRPAQYLPYGLLTTQLQSVLQGGYLETGVLAVQDEAAGLVIKLLDPQPNEVLIDTCAAPGGKTTHAAMLMQNKGRILAFDLHEKRLRFVQEAAEKQGISVIERYVADFRVWATQAPVQADKVLLDVPCSGTGVLAKRADLRWQRSLEQVNALPDLQLGLLEAAAQVVKEEGVMVYSTCSIEIEENEAIIQAFLDRNPSFMVESAIHYLAPALVSPEGFYKSMPHLHKMDGAFGARLRKIRK